MKRWIAMLLIAALTLALFCGCKTEEPEYFIAETDDLISAETAPENKEPEKEEEEAPSSETKEPEPEKEEEKPEEEEPKEEEPPAEEEAPPVEEEPAIDEDGAYTTKEDVALYIYTYGHLPDNFITKKEAESLGWSGGGLDDYAYGCCIGGNRFGNYEGLLPEADGRTYTECDIDTMHASKRGAKRIVFSNDGLIYYTDDHYESFTLLYGEE